MLARTTRADLPDFIYGTPVLELAMHNSRVTAVASSSDGHLLASADERGYVKLLLLVQMKGRSHVGKGDMHEWKRKQGASVGMLQQRPENIRLGLRAHEGPIFSMQWLPITATVDREMGPRLRGLGASAVTEEERIHCYSLATGSSDRVVRNYCLLFIINSNSFSRLLLMSLC
jgi:hypothetical protein